MNMHYAVQKSSVPALFKSIKYRQSSCVNCCRSLNGVRRRCCGSSRRVNQSANTSFFTHGPATTSCRRLLGSTLSTVRVPIPSYRAVTTVPPGACSLNSELNRPAIARPRGQQHNPPPAGRALHEHQPQRSVVHRAVIRPARAVLECRPAHPFNRWPASALRHHSRRLDASSEQGGVQHPLVPAGVPLVLSRVEGRVA
jgi:hypothetical protein